jgi:branched-chain amino acid transport system ATP-binding protein
MLEVRKVQSGYGSFEVLHGVSLEVGDKEIVTLLGHNGAGKSTLLKTIVGQIPTLDGEVFFKDAPLARRSPGAAARVGVRYVPQEGNVFPNISVLDNLKMGAYAADPDAALMHERLESVFALFPVLKERQKAYGRVLSGGQRQMLAISMALMTAPQLLLLDEPSSGLSPVNTQRVFDTIGKLRDDLGTSVLLVEQNVNEGLRLGTRAYVMQEGQIVFTAPTSDRDAIIHHLWGLAKTAEVMEKT